MTKSNYHEILSYLSKKKIIVYFGLITTAIALLQIRKLKHLDWTNRKQVSYCFISDSQSGQFNSHDRYCLTGLYKSPGICRRQWPSLGKSTLENDSEKQGLGLASEEVVTCEGDGFQPPKNY